jgi:PAS domain S-box-containing protein
MSASVWVPLFGCVAAAAIAAAIVARDPGQKVNRLVALVLVASAHWSLCEVVWNLLDDPEQVVHWIRLSACGWIWMGPLSLHVYVELAQDARSRSRRLLRPAYACSAVGLVLYVATPWGVASAIPLDSGWSFRFGPAFPVAYLPTALCVGYVLWKWPRFFVRGSSPTERRLAVAVFASMALAMSVASTTDALLPALGHHVPRLGSTSLLALGIVVAWSVSRHGYFLLAPGAFAAEILETLRDGVALLGDDGRVRFCNAAFAELAGRPAAALLGTPARDCIPQLGELPPDEDVSSREMRMPREDGDRIPVDVASSRLWDGKRHVVGRVLALRDLREVAALRSRLVTSGRLAAVGELAAGIAHEINNPITFVRSNLIQLRARWTELAAALEKADAGPGGADGLEEGEELIEESLEGIDRMASIVRDVRSFSHAGLGHAELADVNELLENAANVASLRYAVTVERCYGDLPPVRCAPHQLRQVFLNLIFNALQAVGEAGRIRLVTQCQRDTVIVRVQDDGCGIEAGMIERIFDPFFTTRPAGEGTGLGLALCYQIVRNHGGDIAVESEPGRGTSFFVHLPSSAG